MSTALSNRKKDFFICGAVLLVLVALYNFVWLNRSLTLSEGWTRHYLNLIYQGKLPYRDYYYYLPPLNLIVDFVFWKLSFGYFFVFRLWRLVERLFISFLGYKLLCKKMDCKLAALIGFFGTVLASAINYDLIGDYNQTTQLLVVLLTCVLIKYFEDNRNPKYLLFSGIIAGCMLGIKQTVILSSGVVFASLFIILAILKIEKNIFKDLLYVLGGFSIPVVSMLTYLLLTGSFSSFVNNVFGDTSSKGSLYDITVKSQLNFVMDNSPIVSVIFILFVFKYLQKYFSLNEKRQRILIVSKMVLLILFLLVLNTDFLVSFFTRTINSFYIFIFIGFVLVLLAVQLFGKNKKLIQYLTILAVLLLNSILLIVNEKMARSVFVMERFDSVIQIFLNSIYIYVVLWLLYSLLICASKKAELNMMNIVMAAGAISSVYSSSMATGSGTMSPISSFILIPAFALIMLDEIKSEKPFRIKGSLFATKIALKVIVLFFVAFCLTQKLVCSYSWCNDAQASFWDKTEKSSYACLEGFRFSRSEYKKYDGLADVIRNNSDADDVIYAFPFGSVYNVLLENYNLTTYCPIPFYDVCSDAVARGDAILLAQNKPEIILWVDMPGALDFHEEVFRDGEEIGQRQIYNWILNEIENEHYVLLDSADNVYVYKLVE